MAQLWQELSNFENLKFLSELNVYKSQNNAKYCNGIYAKWKKKILSPGIDHSWTPCILVFTDFLMKNP